MQKLRWLAPLLVSICFVVYVWRSQSPYWQKVKSPEVLPNWILCVGTLVGIGVAVWTLRSISAQTRAAVASAKAAKDSIAISLNSERAWVIDEIRQIEKLPEASEAFAAYLTFKNLGRVPAIIMGLKIRFHTFRPADIDEFIGGNPLPKIPAYDDDQIFLEIGDRGVILAPNQNLTVARPFEEEGGKLANHLQLFVPTGQRRLCCYGLITYDDGVGRVRRNQFCYMWDADYDPNGVIPNFHRFGPIGYNYAD